MEGLRPERHRRVAAMRQFSRAAKLRPCGSSGLRGTKIRPPTGADVMESEADYDLRTRFEMELLQPEPVLRLGSIH